MSASSAQTGAAPEDARPRIVELSVDVDEQRMSWRLTLELPGAEHEVRSGTAELNITERRRATIGLLATLLRRYEDRLFPEALQDDMYGDLLVVLGHELFDLLFSDAVVRERVAEQLSELRRSNVDLFRLRLAFDGELAPWLAALPWEYVCTPEGEKLFEPAGFLAEARELVLSRMPPLSTDLISEAPPVKVLLVVASPDDFADQDKFPRIQSEDVIKTLRELEDAGLVKLYTLLDDVNVGEDGEVTRATGASIVTELRLREFVAEVDPVILHYIGHGRSWNHKAEIALEREDGEVHWFDGDEFVQIVSGGRRLKLAFLQAYESELPDPYASFSGVARRLAAELPAVVAMQYRAGWEGATSFAVRFYDALLRRGLPIDHAVEQGRIALLDSPGADHMARGLPVVYLGGYGSLVEKPPSNGRRRRAEEVDRNDVVLCPRCDVELPPQGQVCTRCGLRMTCSICGTAFPDAVRTRFCPSCGTKVKERPFPEDKIEQRTRPSGDAGNQVINALRELQGRERDA